MDKQLKDYLHFYLMAEVLLQVKRKNDKEYHIGRMCEITRKSNHGDWVQVWFDDVITVTSNTWNTSSANSHWFFFGEDEIKPLLRPLSDMTGKELQECGNMVYDFTDEPDLNNHKWQDFQTLLACDQFVWLLSKQFDVFMLIEAGLAIDKTKVNNGG